MMRHPETNITVAPGMDVLTDLWTVEDGQPLIQRCGRVAVHLSEILERIEVDMTVLSQQTRGRNGVGLVLTLQRRGSGAVSLRWKTSNQHTLSAVALAERVKDLPSEARRWYAGLDAKARWLNARERLVRHARQVLRDLSAERTI